MSWKSSGMRQGPAPKRLNLPGIPLLQGHVEKWDRPGVQTAPFPRGLDLDLAFNPRLSPPRGTWYNSHFLSTCPMLMLGHWYLEPHISQPNPSLHLPSPKSNFLPWGSTGKTRSCTTSHVPSLHQPLNMPVCLCLTNSGRKLTLWTCTTDSKDIPFSRNTGFDTNCG